jgi:polysaccharide deacetylase family protein (PEP-CTERM system associated)
MHTLNILSIDVEDWFHILDSPAVPEMKHWDNMDSCIEASMDKILTLLAEYDVKATFFWLGWSAERHKKLVRFCAESGHEIACHGYNHTPAREVVKEVFVEEICRGKKVLEDITGHKVVGFRAPGFIRKGDLEWTFEEIQAAGYRYDSSIFPTTSRFGSINTVPVGPCFIKTRRGMLLEIPMSVVEIFNLRFSMFGGGYLRLAPKFMIEWGVKKLHSKDLPLIVYVHPRELDPDYPRLPLSLIQRFKCYVNLKTTMPKLRWLCKNYSFDTMRTMLKVFPDSLSSKENNSEIPVIRLENLESLPGRK